MKIIKEEIDIDGNRSFKIFSPRLKNYFYWHYHPEIELVFVEAINGIRHVGKNISGFVENDLVLIGSNVPHLNFDYGIETDYHQIVVQVNDRFIENNIAPVPEFQKYQKVTGQFLFRTFISWGDKNESCKKAERNGPEQCFFFFIRSYGDPTNPRRLYRI